MAQDSRNVRKKRRVKANLSRTRKQMRETNAQFLRTHSTLLMVLAQSGGITVTQGTMQSVLQNLQTLTWATNPTETPGEFRVSLHTPSSAGDSVPSDKQDNRVTIKRISDDEPDTQVSEGEDAAVDAPAIEQVTGAEVV